MTAAPHVLLSAGGTREVTLKVPYVLPQSRIRTGQSLGRFTIAIMSELGVGPAAIELTASVSVFARFPDSAFQILDPTFEITPVPILAFPEMQVDSVCAHEGCVNAPNVLENGFCDFHFPEEEDPDDQFCALLDCDHDREEPYYLCACHVNQPQPGFEWPVVEHEVLDWNSDSDEDHEVPDWNSDSDEDVIRQVHGNPEGNIITNNSNIEAAAGATIDYSSATSASNETKVGEHDMPNVGLNYQRFLAMPFFDVANMTNVTQGLVVGAHPGRVDPVPPNIFGSADEMELRRLWTRATFVERVKWSTTAPSGDFLLIRSMVPNYDMASLVPGASVTPSLASFTSIPFRFWSGGADCLKLTIMVIGTKVHTGRIVVVSRYGDVIDPGESLATSMAQYAQVYEFTPTNAQQTFTFPWRSDRAWLRMPQAGDDFTDPEFSMGTWAIRIVNQLRGTETVSSEVDILLFWSLGDSFRVQFPGSGASTYHLD
jgi:hypothetical protein